MAQAETDYEFRHPWEDESLAESYEPARSLPPSLAFAANDATALLAPLAEASAALARLDARIATADSVVGQGLLARLALREAAGWLAHQHGAWVHPVDLGLRQAGLTGSVTAAAMGGRLQATLPSTLDGQSSSQNTPHTLAEDLAIDQALEFARLWRRLAELRSWAPLNDTESLIKLLAQLGCHTPAEAAVTAWRQCFTGRPSAKSATIPILLRAGMAAQAWAEHEVRHGGHLPTAALFLAACLCRRAGATPQFALPFWSAAPGLLETLGLLAGPAWLPAFLGAVADAALRGVQELSRLQTAAERASALQRTARSQLPAASATALRLPVLTARALADELNVSPQAALILLKQLVAVGMLREATGRAAWRAFIIA